MPGGLNKERKSEMKEYQCTVERFLKDTQQHKIAIIKDESVYRHIRLSKGSFDGCYDVLTWPGHLCITGDYGSYLFARIEDMFEFFRSKSGELKINPGYWDEKVLSESRFGGGVQEFSVEEFTKYVSEVVTDGIENEEEKAAMMEEIDDLLHCGDEYECNEAIANFDSDKIDFTDFWEHDCKVYTFHFIWCLYAIVFAIQKYDELKANPPIDGKDGNR